MQTRTQWHDLIGRHCPRFAMDRTVVMPLPRPVGFLGEEEYKLALSFEGAPHHPQRVCSLDDSHAASTCEMFKAFGCATGERHQTLWLPVLPPAHKLERAAQTPHMLHVTLVRRPLIIYGSPPRCQPAARAQGVTWCGADCGPAGPRACSHAQPCFGMPPQRKKLSPVSVSLRLSTSLTHRVVAPLG